jgi:hypothetical protein
MRIDYPMCTLSITKFGHSQGFRADGLHKKDSCKNLVAVYSHSFYTHRQSIKSFMSTIHLSIMFAVITGLMISSATLSGLSSTANASDSISTKVQRTQQSGKVHTLSVCPPGAPSNAVCVNGGETASLSLTGTVSDPSVSCQLVKTSGPGSITNSRKGNPCSAEWKWPNAKPGTSQVTIVAKCLNPPANVQCDEGSIGFPVIVNGIIPQASTICRSGSSGSFLDIECALIRTCVNNGVFCPLDKVLNAFIHTNGKIPKDGSKGAFGYGIDESIFF